MARTITVLARYELDLRQKSEPNIKPIPTEFGINNLDVIVGEL